MTTLSEVMPRVPMLALEVIPLCVLLPCAMLPSVRSLSPVSTLANLAILAGYLSISSIEINRYSSQESKPPIEAACWSTFPIFFGIVMSSFEGIGTVLPIEESIHSDKRDFPCLLHSTIGLTTLFLAASLHWPAVPLHTSELHCIDSGDRDERTTA